MPKHNRFPTVPVAPEGAEPTKRAVSYNRVSSIKQQLNDLSLPDQIAQNRAYCERRGFHLIGEIVETGSATSEEHRPQFQSMIEQALSKPPPFDVIVVHSMSRFYRDDIMLELLRRKLRRNRVEIISITQDFGEGAMADITRRVIGMVDELNSRETAKHVKRTMLALARDGWWAPAKVPFGYVVDVVEVVGTRKKRKLKIDPENAAIVRLIFKLCLEGDGTSGPMGIKKIADHLNGHGYKVFGRPFYKSNVEFLLKHECYTGTYWFNKTDSREKVARPREEWVAIPIPQIIAPEDFQRVQVLLRERAPALKAPRIYASKVLLTGVAKCGICGAGMTIATGTSSNGTVVRYYKCGAKANKGQCDKNRRNNIREDKLDELALNAVATSLLTTERVRDIVARISERRRLGKADGTMTLQRLRHQLSRITLAVNNLLTAIADGMITDNDLFREKYQTTLAQRDSVQRLIDTEERQLKEEIQPFAELEAETVAKRVRQRLLNGPKDVQKRLMRALIGEIVVTPDEVVIRGPDEALAELAHNAKSSGNFPLPPVQTLDREWCRLQDSNL